MTKYNTSDNKTVLETGDDVAYQKSNGKWRIPSVDDFQSLINAATAINKETGEELTPGRDLLAGPAEGSNDTKYKIKNKTTNHYITFPLRGYKMKTKSNQDEYLTTTGGYYWTRETGSSLFYAKYYKLSATGTTAGTLSDEFRAAGFMVRGVMYK